VPPSRFISHTSTLNTSMLYICDVFRCLSGGVWSCSSGTLMGNCDPIRVC
jgi:hypothetical protein